MNDVLELGNLSLNISDDSEQDKGIVTTLNSTK